MEASSLVLVREAYAIELLEHADAHRFVQLMDTWEARCDMVVLAEKSVVVADSMAVQADAGSHCTLH